MRKNLSPKRLALIEKYKGGLSQYTKWADKKVANYLVITARKRAARKGVECTINAEDIEPVPSVCPILGIEMKRNRGQHKDDSYSIDRLDPNKGYVPGNVKVISWKANKIKGELSEEQIANLYAYIKGEL